MEMNLGQRVFGLRSSFSVSVLVVRHGDVKPASLVKLKRQIDTLT